MNAVMRRRKTLSCLFVLLLAIPIFGSPMPAQTLDKLDPLVQQRVSLLAGSSEVIVRATDSASVGAVALLIQQGDRQATALFAKFKQRMPDQSLSAAEIEALLDYFAADGPEADARRRQRRADTATAAEIGAGRALFTGERALLYGGGSCISCHRLGEAVATGGTLGPDLSTSYARYQDKGLAALLTRGCFPRAVSTSEAAILTDEESFALRAFLHHEMKAVR